MSAVGRQRRIDDQLWEEGEEALSSDHVVERFFSQHERDDPEPARKAHAGARPKRRTSAPPNSED